MSTQTDVAQLYTAFFDRAPDSAGLAYWVAEIDAGTIDLAAMAKNWVDQQPEGQIKYPTGMTDAAFITAIYGNVLGRAADAEGAQYWQDQLTSGAVSRDVFVAAIISGAHSNTSAQGLLDAQLLDNKATVGIAFANEGINNTTLAAKVLTTVTASDASLSSSLSLVKLIPADSALTPALVTKFSDTLDKVAALIAGAPGEQADLATYLSTLSAGVTSTTNLDTLLTKVGTLATTALTDSSALDNPATLAGQDVAAANPPVDTGGGGGGTGPVDPPAAALTATNVDGVLKITGTGAADVTVDMTAHTVTSGTSSVVVAGGTTFTDVDSSTYSGAVTAVGTVKEIVSGSPSYAGVDRLEVVDKAWTILTWAKYYLLDVDKISVADNAAGTLSVDGYNELVALTGNHDWTYDIRDSVSEINEAVGSGAVLNTETVVVADTLVNLGTPEAATAIAEHPGYIVLDTYAHIAAAAGTTLLTEATSTLVHDTVAGVQAAIDASYVPADGDYEIEDTAANLLAADPAFLKHPSSVTVTGDDAGALNLEQREALGKVTDDDFWAYSIVDSADNVVAALTDHADFLQRAGDVTLTTAVSVAQVDEVVASGKVDPTGWHLSIADEANTVTAHSQFGGFDVTGTATTAATADALDGTVSTGAVTMAFAEGSAATFTFADGGFNAVSVDTFTNFTAATDKIDLSKFGLAATGETLSLATGGSVSDGHFAILNNVVADGEGHYVAAAEGTAGAGSLVLWDGNVAAGVTAVTQVGVFVADTGLTAAALVLGAPAVV